MRKGGGEAGEQEAGGTSTALGLVATATTLTYAGLFAWSFLAATILPLGSEPVVFAAIAGGYSLLPVVVVATLGNYLGACTTYWLALRATSALSTTRLEQTRAGRLALRFGQPVLLLSWVPIIGDALVAAAGAMRMPFLPFSIWVVLGKGARYALVAWGTSTLWG